MHGITKLLSLTLAIVCSATAQGIEKPSSLTLLESWQALIDNDDLLAANQSASLRAEALASTANSLYLPQVDLVGSYTRLDSEIELDALALNPLSGAAETIPGQLLIDLIGGPDAFRTPVTSRNITRSSVNTIWPIYTGGKITAKRNLLQLEKSEASFVVKEVKQARFAELVATYFGLVMAERALNTQQQTEAALARHLHVAQALENQAQISSVERLAAEAAHDRARITTRAVQDQRDTAHNALSSLIHADSDDGRSFNGNALLPTTPLFTLPQLPPRDSFRPGLTEHPQLKILATKHEQAQSVAEASRGLYRPDVFLFGSYNVYENDSFASDLTPDWLVGVGVRIALVDRSGRKGKIGAADNTVREVDSLQRAAQRRLELIFDRSYREATQSLAEHRDLASTVALAEQTLRLQERAFAEGLGRSLDVIDAQTFLAATQTRRDAAALRFVLAFTQLLTLSGDYENLFSYMLDGDEIQ
ncbi:MULTISPECIES: TolC family protein [Marinobacter]|uniref:Membrane protein n=2 Tax=Marinobacter TaxID=2742 RepID=A0A455W225_MARNT|nr:MULTISPECIES: TolC family protein [unclassified Marinobacter]QFS86243.1 Outer membrane efflux protein [Marinobacter sp. THAF197a]QFT50024.1 Outer membrane efflux protein [Marinobacter sp. THAF39]BBJ03244.1 membrane protein [Marinobacter nauticus]